MVVFGRFSQTAVISPKGGVNLVTSQFDIDSILAVNLNFF